jgi:uncharacterized membrane protein
MSEILGIAGAGLILIAWVIEAIKEMKEHKSLVDFQLSALIMVGNALLAVYSYLIDNAVFLWLSVLIAIAIAFEMWYHVHLKKLRRRR